MASFSLPLARGYNATLPSVTADRTSRNARRSPAAILLEAIANPTARRTTTVARNAPQTSVGLATTVRQTGEAVLIDSMGRDPLARPCNPAFGTSST
jgi:hypothetical protein